MGHRGAVLLMFVCFLIMVATQAVDAAAIDYFTVHSSAQVSVHMGGLSDHHTDYFSDEFAFNGRAVVEEKSDEFRSSMDRHEKRDVEALLAFKKHIKSDPTGRLSNWTPENSQQVCSWHGITCRQHSKRVVAVILPVAVPILNPTFGMEGTLSASLGNLSLLHTLNLSGNHLTGEIPADFGQLKTLEILDLSWNNLGGLIPKALCNCTSLKWIELSWNSLRGTIPAEFGRLVKLERLDLSINNNLGGTIPSSLGNCTSLRELSLGSCNFSGQIPSTLGSIKPYLLFTLESTISLAQYLPLCVQ